MSAWLIIAGFLFMVVASAQAPEHPKRSGPVGLVNPIPGAPLSVEQVEERTRTLPDGTSTTQIVTSQIYRDSAGRIRVEWSLESHPVVYLLDPVAHSVAILLAHSKIAHRMLVPSGPDGFAVGFPAMIDLPPAGKWQTKSEALGKRTRDGVEVEGARTTFTSEGQPVLIAVEERWFSGSLGLASLVEASGPDWRHTARLRKIDRREPDRALFTVPSDYTISEP